MKHHPFYLTMAMFAVLLFAGNCRKTETSFESNTIRFSVSGRILDKNNFPVSQAEVKAGTLTVLTDVNGYFTLSNVLLPKNEAYVSVHKNGYFQGSRTFIARAQSLNYVTIRLIPKEITGSFNASGGGIVALPEGSSIMFQPGSVVDAATKAPYTGLVSVAAFFIDPTVPDFTSIMPGDLRGITASNQERGLESFGMMAVELMGFGGQKLQLASGKTAVINFSIPAGLRTRAPASIPLWYFDENRGLWKEEGSASKQGNMYVGTVSHFSFWNCDAPFPLVEFEAVVKDQAGNAVADAEVRIKRLNDNSAGYGRTDSEGRISGKIPANEALEIIINNRCGVHLYTQNIGPFSGNVNLGTIMVPLQTLQTLTITGNVVNCSNTAVANGYVNVSLEGMHYRAPIANGNFSISITRCNNTQVQAEVRATDLNTNQQSGSLPLSVSIGNVNAGQLSACGTTSDQFINYTLDGVPSGFASPGDSLSFGHGDSLNIPVNSFFGSGGSEYMIVDFDGPPVPGTYTIDHIIIITANKKYEGQNFPIVITQFGNVGEYVIGHFTGPVQLGGTSTHTVTCNFKLKRRS